jgi:hypothetical protein
MDEPSPRTLEAIDTARTAVKAFLSGKTSTAEVIADLRRVDRIALGEPLASIYTVRFGELATGRGLIASGEADTSTMQDYARLFDFSLERALRSELWRVGDAIEIAPDQAMVVDSDSREATVTVSSPGRDQIVVTRRKALIPASVVSRMAYRLVSGREASDPLDCWRLESSDGSTNMVISASDVLEIRPASGAVWRIPPDPAVLLGDALTYHAEAVARPASA